MLDARQDPPRPRGLRAFSSSGVTAAKPAEKPASPNFGSGPCKKRPGWSVDALSDGALGRSHRSAEEAKLAQCIADSKRILGVPEEYHLGIVPASDTGAYEMAMWSLLGPRPRGRVPLGVFREGVVRRHHDPAQA